MFVINAVNSNTLCLHKKGEHLSSHQLLYSFVGVDADGFKELLIVLLELRNIIF